MTYCAGENRSRAAGIGEHVTKIFEVEHLLGLIGGLFKR
jgi:hypothetical protein